MGASSWKRNALPSVTPSGLDQVFSNVSSAARFLPSFVPLQLFDSSFTKFSHPSFLLTSPHTTGQFRHNEVDASTDGGNESATRRGKYAEVTPLTRSGSLRAGIGGKQTNHSSQDTVMSYGWVPGFLRDR